MKVKIKSNQVLRFGGYALIPNKDGECELPKAISTSPSLVNELKVRFKDKIEFPGDSNEDKEVESKEVEEVTSTQESTEEVKEEVTEETPEDPSEEVTEETQETTDETQEEAQEEQSEVVPEESSETQDEQPAEDEVPPTEEPNSEE